MPLSSEEALGFFRGADFMLLDVTPEHATVVERLPGVHRDPFDRLLIAQALTEPMRFVTHDAQLAAYSDSIIVF